MSEDTVAKVKVLGKGEAGLKQLEEYIPKVRRLGVRICCLLTPPIRKINSGRAL